MLFEFLHILIKMLSSWENVRKASRGMSRNVDFEVEMCGVFARRINGAEVCLSVMNGMVSVLFEQLYERGHTVNLFDTRQTTEVVFALRAVEDHLVTGEGMDGGHDARDDGGEVVEAINLPLFPSQSRSL